MSDSSLYDPIELETTTFDLIVVGTGLPATIIAAAASASGKTVLHLDRNHFYGSQFASLQLDELTSFIKSHATPPSTIVGTSSTSSSLDYTALDVTLRSVYSNIKTANYAPEILANQFSKFLIDLGGPRVLFCADKAIDLIVKSGVGSYLSFKSIDVSFICDESGRLSSVPDSRSAIFKDKSLSLIEKNQLMRFFKLVQQHLAASAGDDGGNENAKISEEDLESPFADFLKRMRLPPKIKSSILYAISLADDDQDNSEVCKTVLKTREGMERLDLYQKSVGRFPNVPGALLYPLYGHGEILQGFTRRAAVKGCIQVLRMPVTALLMDKQTGQYKGVKLASGEEIFSHQLLLDPTLTVPLPPASSSPNLEETLQVLSLKGDKRKVARGICITTSSLKPDVSNCLLVYPPRLLFSEQDTSIRAIQIGGGSDKLAVCPSGMFVLYFSGLCDDAEHGKRLLHAAMNALLTLPVSANHESGSAVQSEDADVKPTLLWSTLYIQELTTAHNGECENIFFTPMPDGNLNYNDLVDSTVALFQKMYPDEVLFAETPSSPVEPDNLEDDTELSLDS
ncbi:rab escort protein 1 [Pyrus x bretschneideri]|uniref:rab escort protein 1 n=1 Tax=Pyrus x bretschneideri TaxID=225117 RepID=UPI00202F8E2F|nr:rab escort protein 1 [Pyrus x bretschneideri]